MAHIKGFEEGPLRFIAITSLSDAMEFAAAAKILGDNRHARVDSPFYFLISQAIELYLKAYIVSHGGTRKDVTDKDRHSLSGLLSKAKTLGLNSCSPQVLKLIEALAGC
jgi:hypothetical protein